MFGFCFKLETFALAKKSTSPAKEANHEQRMHPFNALRTFIRNIIQKKPPSNEEAAPEATRTFTSYKVHSLTSTLTGRI